MNKALVFFISAVVIFFTFSCSNNTGQKTVAVLTVTKPGDTTIIKDSISPFQQNLFYPDSSDDTNLVMREGDVSVYEVGSDGVDCVVKLQDQSCKSFKIWEQDILEFSECVSVQSRQINNTGNEEVIICFEVEGIDSYGENEDGWYENRKYLQVWDVDRSRIFFECKPYCDFWNTVRADGKTGIDSDFYQYDFNITLDNKIVLSNLMKKVKDKIVPNKAKKADVKMGTYRFQNDTFIWISANY